MYSKEQKLKAVLAFNIFRAISCLNSLFLEPFIPISKKAAESNIVKHIPDSDFWKK